MSPICRPIKDCNCRSMGSCTPSASSGSFSVTLWPMGLSSCADADATWRPSLALALAVASAEQCLMLPSIRLITVAESATSPTVHPPLTGSFSWGTHTQRDRQSEHSNQSGRSFEWCTILNWPLSQLALSCVSLFALLLFPVSCAEKLAAKKVHHRAKCAEQRIRLNGNYSGISRPWDKSSSLARTKWDRKKKEKEN